MSRILVDLGLEATACGRLLAPVLAAQRAIVYARARRALGWEGVAG